MHALPIVNNRYKLQFLFLILFLNLNCKVETVSQKITHFYNADLNDNLLTMVDKGLTNYQLKYMLDTILSENFNMNDTDNKYCIFYFSGFSKIGSAIFIDSNDSIWYLLSEIDRPDKHISALHGIYEIGGVIKHIYYTIERRKIKQTEFNSNCIYKSFFKNITCLKEELMTTEGQPINEMVLKFWNKSNGKLGIEFYDIYDKRPIKEPNRKKTKPILIKEGFDSSKIIQKKIKFIK